MIPKLHYISQGNSPKEHLENTTDITTNMGYSNTKKKEKDLIKDLERNHEN